MPSKAQVVVGNVTIEVIEGRLVEQQVEAIMISANNRLHGKSSRAGDVSDAAKSSYCAECKELAESFGTCGIPQGQAVVTGGYNLTHGNLRRRIIQAVTIGYPGTPRIKATPAILYRATRAGLEKAEIFQISSVATYLMAARYPDYATEPEDVMADTLCRALIDHARIAGSVNRIVIAEESSPPPNINRVQLAVGALNRSYSKRSQV